MASAVVIVNGLPGAGKSTLAGQLGARLGLPLLSKDAVKQALADVIVGEGPRPRLGAIAMDTIWAMAAAMPGPVLIESWWFRPRDLVFARAGLSTATIGRQVEVWCEVPPALARHRYVERDRTPLHPDDEPLPEVWELWSRQSVPLGLGPVVTVDTSTTVDLADVAQRIVKHLPELGNAVTRNRNQHPVHRQDGRQT